MELTSIKVMLIQYLNTFLGGDLQVIYESPLRLACKQNLPCQKASKFSLTADSLEN